MSTHTDPFADHYESGIPIKNLHKGNLLTSDGGEIEIATRDRLKIAIFQNGLAFVAREYRWSSEVKAVFDRAFRAGLEINHIHEVDSQRILEMYQWKGQKQAKTSSGFSRIERQKELKKIIASAASRYASDIHIHVNASLCEVKVRTHGRMSQLCNLASEEGRAIINAAFAVATDQGSEVSQLGFIKGTLTNQTGLLPPKVELIRLQYSPTSGHFAALVMRLKYVSTQVDYSVDRLGFNVRQTSDIKIMCRRTSGLYLLAGKVSSGKTTTLQCILNAMIAEKNHQISVYSIEEPVELNINGAVHVGIFPKPNQTRSEAFIEAIKATLRSDPNVVLLGELRDRELAGYAMELALTGHALWSTVHASSALGILDRLYDLGIELWKLTEPSVVRGLIYQRLLGIMCPDCKITMTEGLSQGQLSSELVANLHELLDISPNKLFVKGPGCPKCILGLVGRTVVAETILPNLKLLGCYEEGNRRAMRDHWLKPINEGGCGCDPIMHHALMKVGQGICDINEVEEEIDLVESYKSDFLYHAASIANELSGENRA